MTMLQITFTSLTDYTIEEAYDLYSDVLDVIEICIDNANRMETTDTKITHKTCYNEWDDQEEIFEYNWNLYKFAYEITDDKINKFLKVITLLDNLDYHLEYEIIDQGF